MIIQTTGRFREQMGMGMMLLLYRDLAEVYRLNSSRALLFLGGCVVFVKGFLCVAFSPKRLHETRNETQAQLDVPTVCVCSASHTFPEWPIFFKTFFVLKTCGPIMF